MLEPDKPLLNKDLRGKASATVHPSLMIRVRVVLGW